MIDKSELRNELLEQICNVDVEENLKMDIDNLTIFNSLNELDMKTFFTNLNNIISWGEINSMQNRHDNLSFDDTFYKTLKILSYIMKVWNINFVSGNIEKLIISFIIGERLFLQPENDFNWDSEDILLEKNLKLNLEKIKFEVSDKIPEYANYSDKKFNTDYKKSVEINDYKGIFIFFDSLERGIGLHSEDTPFINIIVRISLNLDYKLVSDRIGSFTPALLYLVINVMTKENISNLLDSYNDDNLLPLLMGLRKIVSPNNLDSELLSNLDFIEKSSSIIKKIADLYNEDSLYKYITDSIRYSHSTLWNIVYAAFIAKNEEYISDYADNINFENNDYGEYSFDTFKRLGTENGLNKLSTHLFSRFISSVTEMEYRFHPFIFSSFYKYFLYATQVLSEKSCSTYHKMIEDISIKLLRSLYSWKVNDYEPYFTELIYWILSVKEFNNNCKMKLNEFKYTRRIIEDKKIMKLLETRLCDILVNFEELRFLLEDSNKINKVKLPIRDSVIELQWSSSY